MRKRFWITLLVLAAIFVVMSLPAQGPHVEPDTTLVVTLSGGYVESAEPPLFARLLGERRRPFVSVLSELAKAQRDSRITGVLLRIRNVDADWGKAQELRGAIADLGASGHRTVALLETASLGANVEYYVASAADEIVISPAAASPLVGLSMEIVFLGGLWEKLGAGIETLGRGEYKSAAETLAGTSMSPAHREMAESLLDSLYGQFVAGIAEGRGLEPDVVRETIDVGPMTPDDLVRLDLADAVAGYDAALERIGASHVLSASEYAQVDPASVGFEPVARFALVYGAGMVTMGSGTMTPTGGLVFSTETVGRALEDAAEDPEISAIILRVDSPGGSPLAAELIWRSAQRARESGKPFVASVSSMAASGGYYVLAGADAIVAPPGALVGSIGVFVIRPVIGGLLDKLGLKVVSLTRGAHADMLLATRPLSPPGRERMERELDAIYDLFVERVAEGRELSIEEVDAVARGRVWTGEQAAGNGLVDELGGLRVAVARAKREAGLAEDADVALVPYPAPASLAQQLAEALQGAVVRATPRISLPRTAKRLESLLAALPDGAPLLVPPLVVDIR